MIGNKTKMETLDRGAEWDDEASCAPLVSAGMFDEYFYPEHYGRGNAHVIMAKRICAACPVLLECRADALMNNDIHGIKGGMTPRERREFLKRVPKQRDGDGVA